MVITKRINFDNIFLFLFLALFPFGQIIRIGIFQPIDLIAGLAALYVIVKRVKKPNTFKYLKTFLIIAAFSWIFGAALYRSTSVFYGIMYLIRLASYFYFLVYVWNFVRRQLLRRELVINSLILVSFVSAVFGWIQYFLVPSIKPFFVWGWDEHLFRLVGTFLDPTFLGIIIVFGLLGAIYKYMSEKKGIMLFVVVFLLVSLAFTYSRASYLAFLAGLGVIGFYQKKVSRVIYLGLGLILLIALLPTSGNTILRVTREFSAIARVENYKEAIEIFKMSPVFGIGYNNFCLARAGIDGFINLKSHACSGSDSSILFFLATTGITGLISLIYGIKCVASAIRPGKISQILVSVSVALLVHSIFSNSMVYSWVMGYLMIVLAASLKE